MSVLSGKTIASIGVFEHKRYPTLRRGWVPSGSSRMIEPLVERQLHKETGTSFGLSMCGYDIRIDQDLELIPGRTILASTMEKFNIPRGIMGVVHDKSTWARRGISVQNTIIEPGWSGFLTLELLFSPLPEWDKLLPAVMNKGTPIAQVIFHEIDDDEDGYGDGKYQNQERGPQKAR